MLMGMHSFLIYGIVKLTFGDQRRNGEPTKTVVSWLHEQII